MSDLHHTPPDNLWDVDALLEFNEALASGDPRYVPTAEARGNFSLRPLLRTLGVDDRDPDNLYLRKPHPRGYNLFCGHRGCGKSTELRRLADCLHGPKVFFVVFLDVLEELDYHNLQYADVLLTLAKDLFETLEQAGIELDDVLLANLHDWFKQRIETNEKTKDFAAEIKAGAQAESGIPFFGKLFAEISTAIKNNSSYKEELRLIVENSFSQFADSFNLCLRAAEDAARRAGLGCKILFIVDGTDRLRDKDSERFFVGDVHQLKQVDANFVYCAPISLLYESNQVQQEFYHFILPMIKLREKHDPSPLPEGYAVMQKMIYRRAHQDLFTSPQLVDRLIEHSGGSPRDLLKLLHYAFLRATDDQFDPQAVEAAIQDLATDYKRILDSEDYALLHAVDQSREAEQNSPRVRHCLYHLLLLEYNGFWRMSHPVIRGLPGYRRAAEQHG